MKLILPQWLRPPGFSTSIQNQLAQTSYTLQIVLAFGYCALTMILLLSHQLDNLIIILALLILSLLSFWISSWGHFQIASLANLTGMLGAITWFVLHEPEGLHNVAILGLPIAIIIASLTLNRFLFVVLVGFIISQVAFITYLEAAGKTASLFSSYFPNNAADGSIIMLVVVLVAVAIRLIVERMFTNFERANRTQQQLQRTVSELERRNREVVLLSQLSELLQVCHTAAEAHHTLSIYLPQFFTNEAGELYIFSLTRDEAVRVARWGTIIGGEQVDRCDLSTCWAVRRGHLVVVDNPQAIPACGHINNAEAPINPYLCAPLLAYNTTMGFLHIRSSSLQSTLSTATQQLALAVAEQMALALAHLDLHESLREQSIRDPLTNLFNRRFMQESLARELQRAERTGSPLAVIFCDLDRFKYFNDTFGHAAGDAVLCALADLLRLKTRGSDIVCRYGGEEFVLILPDAALEPAAQRMEELRREVKLLTIQHNGQQLDPLTISIGVEAFPTHGHTAEALLKAADEATYWAKTEGRDRVITASLPTPQEPWDQPIAEPKGRLLQDVDLVK